MSWEQWADVHSDSDQQKRIARAYLAENTPVSISAEDCTGEFQGSHGRYKASLDGCTCVDFNRQKRPCKHMYRLAIELGLFGDKSEAKSDQLARKIPKGERSELIIDLIGRIENCIDSEQIELKKILLEVLHRGKTSIIYEDYTPVKNLLDSVLLVGHPVYEYFIQRMNISDMKKTIADQGGELPKDCKLKKDITKWMIDRVDQYGPLLFPNCLEVKPSPQLNLVSLSIYKYLHRKFDESARKELVWNPNTGLSEWIETGFPDDFITGLLNLFGTNPCCNSATKKDGDTE